MLLESGSTLMQRWYSDVPWGTRIWRATQLLSLYQMMDRPGPFVKDKSPLGSKSKWGVDQPLSKDELKSAIAKLKELNPKATPLPAKLADSSKMTAGEFALSAQALISK